MTLRGSLARSHHCHRNHLAVLTRRAQQPRNIALVAAVAHTPSPSPRRPITTSTTVKMPVMPKNILKEGKEKLQLKDSSLLKTQAYINGQWQDSISNKTFPVHNKATNAEIGTCPDMASQETYKAIDAASEAFKSWSTTTAKSRADLLTKLFNALTDNAQDLAHIIVAENGKSLSEAKGEVTYSNSFIEHFAGEATRTYGHVAPAAVASIRNVIVKKPIGVAGIITPWNFPAAMITRKLGPALAAGCTVVIKAPAETPFSALAIAEICHRVGIPKGVVNIVTCAKGETETAVGKALCESPKVAKISFTGSTRVGKILMKQSADTLKKLSMELGGNAPFIVFADANLDLAVEGAMACKMRASGQTCVCANRIFVADEIYDEFAKRFAAKVDAMHVGYGMDDGVTHGPLVNQIGLDKVEKHVQECVKAGAKVLVGGKRGEGLFFEPTVLGDVQAGKVPMDDEETFGPLAALYRFKSEAEVLALANDVNVGLAGYFFSQDVSRCWRVADALQTGMVGINSGVISQAAVPFGGIKESGFGREGGRSGIDEYMYEKLYVFGGAE